jgi:nicotinamidase-related amidase
MKKNKILICIDLQEDFFTGSLKNQMAIDIIPNIIDKIKDAKDNKQSIMFTLDTHSENYLKTQEGKNLPISHCIEGTPGHQIISQIRKSVSLSEDWSFEKNTFGSLDLANYLTGINTITPIDEIELIGVVSSICVVSNALLIKAHMPEVKITVDASCCAGLSEEDQKAAMIVMKMCQINIINNY